MRTLSSPLNKERRPEKGLISSAMTSMLAAPAPIAAALAAFMVYWLTLFQDITWQNFASDGPELITASVTLGIPHPPGYPTYTVLGKLFSLLPLGDTYAYRFNLFSAVSMAIAVGFLTAGLINQLSSDEASRKVGQLPIFGIALTFALIPLVWQQAVVSEVYALNLLLVAAVLWLLLRPKEKKRYFSIGLLLGLSVTTHLTSLLLIPLVLSQSPIKRWLRAGAGFALGLTPFLALPILSQSGSPVTWGNAADIEGWLWLVSADLYGLNFPLPAVVRDSNLLGAALSITLAAWVFTAITGLVSSKEVFGKSLVNPPTAMICLTAGFYFIFAGLYKTYDSILILLPAFLLISFIIGRLIVRAGVWLLILPVLMIGLNLLFFQKEEQALPRSVGEAALSGAPEDAVLITSGERTTFTLWYLHFVENQREDLVLVDKDLLQFDWYREQLGDRYTQLNLQAGDDVLGFISLNERNHIVCVANIERSASLSCSHTDNVEAGL